MTFLMFSGYYEVASAADILSLYKIRNRIVRAPVSLNNSCSYAVLIDKREEEMSRCILQTKGIKVL